jgi:hypothetical protein
LNTTGLFLAMPLIAAVTADCSHVPEWRAWANLMSSHDEMEPLVPEPSRDRETHVGPTAPKEPAVTHDGHPPEDST